MRIKDDFLCTKCSTLSPLVVPQVCGLRSLPQTEAAGWSQIRVIKEGCLWHDHIITTTCEILVTLWYLENVAALHQILMCLIHVHSWFYRLRTSGRRWWRTVTVVTWLRRRVWRSWLHSWENRCIGVIPRGVHHSYGHLAHSWWVQILGEGWKFFRHVQPTLNQGCLEQDCGCSFLWPKTIERRWYLNFHIKASINKLLMAPFITLCWS